MSLVTPTKLVIAAPAHTNTKPPAILTKLVRSIKAAKAFEYHATVTCADITSPGVIGKPHVFDVECREQEPNLMKLTIQRDGTAVATFASNDKYAILIDDEHNLYKTLPPIKNETDWHMVHEELDTLTRSSDIGNIFDSTLIHKPMLDIAEQNGRTVSVEYTLAPCLVNGQSATHVAQRTTASGLPMMEDVYIGDNGRLLSYSVSFEIESRRILAQKQEFKKLKLLQNSLPESIFDLTPPTSASEFQSAFNVPIKPMGPSFKLMDVPTTAVRSRSAQAYRRDSEGNARGITSR